MRACIPIAVVLLSLVLSACSADAGNDADQPPEGTGAPIGGEIRVAGFSTPESVLHDPAADVYLVSNINGAPLDKDDNGFISLLSPEGQVLELRWIDGASDDVMLDAPKGMAVLGDSLYVTDIDCVRIFHRVTGTPSGSVCLDGATFLNDIAVDAAGAIYVTDTGLHIGTTGMEPAGTDAVWRVTPAGETTKVLEGTELGGPNGIAFGPGGADPYVVTFGSGEAYRLLPDGSRLALALPDLDAQLDGIVVIDDGSFLMSSWGQSAVLHVGTDGTVRKIFEGLEAPADIGYDARRRRILIPLFLTNEVLITDLPSLAPAGP